MVYADVTAKYQEDLEVVIDCLSVAIYEVVDVTVLQKL